MPGTLASALMISSVIPSLKYSFSGSALMFGSGRTAIALAAACGASVRRRRSPAPGGRPVDAGRSASANCAAVRNRSTGVRGQGAGQRVVDRLGHVARDPHAWESGEMNRLAMMACAVGPVNGGSPVSISYRTQPRL